MPVKMRTLTLIGIIVLLILASMVSAASDESWNKTFGGTSSDWAESVQQTSDGGYILAGYTMSYGAGIQDVWLVKTDSKGNKEWDRTFGGTSNEWAKSVQQTSDGGYILAGSMYSYGASSRDFWLVKTDSDGNKEWDKTFGGTSYDRAESVQQTSDGGYILAGDTKSYGAGEVDSWLVKTDSDGNKMWDKTFGGTDDDRAYSVQQTSDGGYILAGDTKSYGAGSRDFWLVKTDSNGNRQWDKIFGGTGWDVAYSVQQTSDGGYILAGETRSYGAGDDFWLVKTDSDGNKEWDKTFGGTGAARARSVQQTSDGGYILIGCTYSYDVGWDFWLVKTDSNGNKEWDKTFGGTDNDGARSVQQTSDGGYILAGRTRSYGAGASNVWLLKTDSMGNMLLGEASGGTGVVTPTPAVTSRSTHVVRHTPAPQEEDSSSWLWVGLFVGLVLLIGLKLNRKSKPSTPAPVSSTQHTASGGAGVPGDTSARRADPQINEIERVIQRTESALQDAVRKAVNISQSTQELLQDAQKALAAGDFTTAKTYAHKCSENVGDAVKEFERQKAERERKEREQREVEPQRKDASDQIESTNSLIEDAERLGVTVQHAIELNIKAQSAFDTNDYGSAISYAKQSRDAAEKLIQESKNASVQIKSTNSLIEDAERLGVTVQNAKELNIKAQSSFNANDYISARRYALQSRDAAEKLIEESKPSISIELPPKMQYNLWKHRDLTVTNKGTVHAKDVVITFLTALEVRELEVIKRLDVGEQKTISINTKPTEKGEVPVDYSAEFKDFMARDYKTEGTTTVRIGMGTETAVERVDHESVELGIKRGYEALSNNDLRFGIRVENHTGFAVMDVQTILDYPRTLFSLKGDVVQTLANIHPNGERTAKYLLTPLGCVHNEKINAIIRYKDHIGETHTAHMQPKEVHCVCPFLKEKAMREGEFAELAAKSKFTEEGISFSGIDVSGVVGFIKESCAHRLYTVGEHEIGNTTVLYLAGESIGEKAYYLLTAIVGDYKGTTQVVLRVHSDKTYGLRGFLNEMAGSLRHLVGSVQSAKEIGIIENKQVINIIDSVVQRTSFGGAGHDGRVEVNVKDSVVHQSEVGGRDAD